MSTKIVFIVVAAFASVAFLAAAVIGVPTSYGAFLWPLIAALNAYMYWE